MPANLRRQGQQWIVCQIGAREHYVLAAELHRRGQLAVLCTDIWASEGSLWKIVADVFGARGRKIHERYEPALRNARVFSEWPISLRPQVHGLARGHWNWDRILLANRRFAASMARRLERSGVLRSHAEGDPAVVFAYSYAAREILATAKRAGCIAVLGQIDPGPEEHALIARVAERHGHSADPALHPPDRYWNEWRRECALADIVIVNSSWSASLVARAGISDKKIRIVPLAYRQHAALDPQPPRVYPDVFSASRPLNLLFLGQLNLRKGILELIAAMHRLSGAPVRLRMVGPLDPSFRTHFALPSNVEWVGAVSRSAVKAYYRQADLFILPTHSDGFAITQLEALAHGLPVIASRYCGDVIIENQNGHFLEAVTADAVEKQLRWALDHPKALACMSVRGPACLLAYAPERVVDALLAAVSSVRR